MSSHEVLGSGQSMPQTSLLTRAELNLQGELREPGHRPPASPHTPGRVLSLRVPSWTSGISSLILTSEDSYALLSAFLDFLTATFEGERVSHHSEVLP